MTEPPARVRAFGYARVSRPGEEAILRNQVVSIERYAAARGIVLAEPVFEETAPGTDRRLLRPHRERKGQPISPLVEMLSAVEATPRPVDLVVFTGLSRMTRGGVESALYILNRLRRAGVGFHFVDVPVLNFDSATPPLAQEIILAVLAAVDKDFRRNISVKTKAAYETRKQLAAVNGTALRWGRHKNSCECDRCQKRWAQDPRKRGIPKALSETVRPEIGAIVPLARP